MLDLKKKNFSKKISSHKTRVVFRRSTLFGSIIANLVIGWCNYQKNVSMKSDHGEDFGTQSYHKINEQWEG